MKYLVDSAFHPPKWALNPEIFRRIEPVGVLDRIEQAQTRVLNSMLSAPRVLRLVEQEAVDGAGACAPLDFPADVRKGVFAEIDAPGSHAVDAYRRNLRRAYVETLSSRINGPQAQSDDARAFFRGELKTLEAELQRIQQAPSVPTATQNHVADIRALIARALDPTAQPPAAARSTTADIDGMNMDSCWPDYAITPRRN